MKFKCKHIIIAVTAWLAAASCSKMNDLHEKYLDKETIYAAQVDTAEALAGKNRVMLNLDVRSQRVDFVRVHWGDSAHTDVTVNGQVGIFSKIIENMDENNYIFKIVSYDKFGNTSLPLELSGSVYGDRFQSQLSNRTIREISSSDEGLTVNFGAAPDYALGCFLKYTNMAGTEQTAFVPDTVNAIHINDWASGLSYRTIFKPEKTAIDTFYTDWRTVTYIPFKYSTAGWTAASRNGNHNWDSRGGQPEKLFDGDLETGWHSNPSASLPQCLVVDMQESQPVYQLVIRFQANAIQNNWIYLKTVQVYLTDTPVTPDEYQTSWGSPAVSYNYPGGIDIVTIPLAAGSSGRYLVLYFPDSGSNSYISFTELEVYR
ncbi:MAG: discoidin domain-containing protein [Prevotellaceae bacterium]|jgi:hypothetical protein|nr:discoidin domain-containing protein [Prevotellaceae bacterium]